MYHALAYVHLTAAATWIGGMIFIAAILVPTARGMHEPPGAGLLLLRMAARRFRCVGWGALVLLVITGLWLLHERGVDLARIHVTEGEFHDILRVKMVLVAVMVVLSSIHDFVLGPRLARRMIVARQQAGEGSLVRQRKLIGWMARANLLLVLAILAASLGLLRGNPF
ncbi:MAG: DUF4149 domain-containing protein [Dehalococcoidia bacterium]